MPHHLTLDLSTPPSLQVDYPCKFLLERELADHFYSFGGLRSALELYLKVRYYSGIIKCYAALDQVGRAKELIHERLEHEPTNPDLWCSLAELNDDDEVCLSLSLSQTLCVYYTTVSQFHSPI